MYIMFFYFCHQFNQIQLNTSTTISNMRETKQKVFTRILATLFCAFCLAGCNDDESGQVVDGERIPNAPGDEASGTVTDVFHRLDFSIPVGISYRHDRFTVDLRYDIALTRNIYKYINSGIRNSNISLVLGYGFTL